MNKKYKTNLIFQNSKDFLKKVTNPFLSVSQKTYQFITRIPIIGSIVRTPEKIYKVATMSDIKTPLVAKSSDIAAYLVKMKRENSKYKLTSLVAIVFLIFAFATSDRNAYFSFRKKPYVARIKLHGGITSSSFGLKENFVEVFDKIRKDNKIIAVIFDIESPGGSASSTETIFRHIKSLSSFKHTAAVVHNVAASGGYAIAVACKEIVAQETSVIGSIGVLTVNHNIKELEEKLGIKTTVYKTSIYKAAPNMFEETSDEIDRSLQESLTETFQWFSNIVKESRNLTDDEINNVANGKVFSGRKALANKLIDMIGNERSLLDSWIKDNRISRNTKVVNIKLGVNKQGRGGKKASSVIKQMLTNMVFDMQQEYLEEKTDDKTPQFYYNGNL